MTPEEHGTLKYREWMLRVERGEATGIEERQPQIVRHMYLPEPDQAGRVYHAWMYAGGVVYARSLHEADALAETWGMTVPLEVV